MANGIIICLWLYSVHILLVCVGNSFFLLVKFTREHIHHIVAKMNVDDRRFNEKKLKTRFKLVNTFNAAPEIALKSNSSE